MAVGALDPERDFLDIRDVCDAYIACIEKIDGIPNNQILNIASGRPVKIGMILDALLGMAKCPISVRQDPSRLRPVEIPRAVGDAALAKTLLCWQPRFKLEDTLESVLNFARHRAVMCSP
jgi:GDP-4-dehydro-6-deoxy-D-mannose reductase